jgi:predicted nucleotidyltransferase
MQQTINKIVAYIVQIAEPDEVILFGSMAHGTNNVHSDIDLLIVTDGLSQKRQIVERVQQFAHEMALRADVLVYSRQDLDQACADPHSFLSGVRSSGKIVYQKDGK